MKLGIQKLSAHQLPLDPRCRCAFTLAELLVTIAVIVILAAILIPALSRAKNHAKTVQCGNNLRQLTVSWKMYADDNQGKLISSIYLVVAQPGIAYRYNTNSWVLGSMDDDKHTFPPIDPGVLDSTNINGLKRGALFPYIKSILSFRCPADFSSTNGTAKVRSYSMNGWLGGVTSLHETNYLVFKRESQIVRPPPSSTWVLIDEHERSINDGWFAVDMEGKYGLVDVPASRHDSSAYEITFADGHIETWKVMDNRTIHWRHRPVSNQPLNPDWQRLSGSTTALIRD